MRSVLYILLLIGISQFANAQSLNCDQSNLSPFCSGIAQYPANFDGTGAGSGPQAPVGPNYDCLGTQGNPTYFSLTIENTGSIDFTLSNTANVDIDFILWGPFASMNDALLACDSMGTGGFFGNVADCSYSVVAQEQVSIPNAIQGEVYILMVTNFANVSTNIFSTQNIGTGSVACPCDIPFRADTIPAALGNQGYLVDTLNNLNTYLVCPNNTLGVFLGSAGNINDTLSLFGPFTNINSYFSNYSIFQTYPNAPQQDSIEIYALITPDYSDIGVSDITLGLKNDIFTGGFSDSSCFDQAFFRIIVPGVQLNNRQVCSGESFQVLADSIPSTSLGASNYNWYQISGPTVNITGSTTRNPSINIPSLSSTTPADSIQIVVDYQYGSLCSMSDTMTLYFDDVSLFLLAAPDTVCVGQTSTLTAVLSDTLAPSQCDAYTVTNIPFSPIAGSGTTVNLADDAVTAALPIGFNFNFYCNNYSSFVISSNGFISFDLSAPNGCCNGQTIPNPFTPNDFIALCWTDCNPSAGGNINYFTTGTAPNRQLIVNFFNVPPYSTNSGNQTVQAILYETTNTIDIHVTNATPSGLFSNLTIGIENATGTNGHVPPTTNATTTTISNTSFRFEQINNLPTYSWTPPIGLNNPTLQNPTATINSNTIFQALVTDGGCTYQDSVEIITVAGLATPTVNCDSASISSLSFSWTDIGLPASGFYEYSIDGGTTWINAGSSLTATLTSLLANTPYTILVRANDGTGGPCPLSNAGSANCSTLNADCASNPPLNISLQGVNNLCYGDSSGCVISNISGGSGNPLQLNWSNGLVNVDSICNLTAGTYTLIASDTFSLNPGGTTQNLVYAENFDGTHNWTLNVPTGANGSDNNFWQVDSDEAGMPVGACGTSGGSNRSMHITSVFNPLGGAAYDAGGLCPLLFCPETNMRTESPAFSTVGFTNLSLSFHYIANGNGLVDNASVWYDDGSGWTQLTASIKSATCGSGQGLWTLYTANLPASCENNPALRIGINWSNNDDGIGTDPSVAIDSVQVISATSNSNLISCVDSATITIVEPSQMVTTIDSFTNPSCSGAADGAIYTSTNGGTPGYSFSWSNADTTSSISSANDGTYILTITDINGCTDTISQILTVPNPILINTTQITNNSCNDNPDGSITISGAGGTGTLTYQWSTGSTDQTLTNISDGLYVVTVTDANGCFDTAQIQLIPTIFIQNNVNIIPPPCFGDLGTVTAATSGGSGSYSYTWSANASTSNAVNLGSGTYSVTVTDITNNCQDTLSFSVSSPAELQSTLVSQINIGCDDSTNIGALTVSISGGTSPYTYNWNTGQTDSTINNLAAGIYNLVINDDNNCSDSSSYTITQAEQVSVDLDSIMILLACDGVPNGSLQAIPTGGSSFSYQWSTGDSTALVSSLSAGTYTVTVTNQDGCSDTISAEIVSPLIPDLNAYINTIGLQSDAINLDDPASLFSGITDTSNTSFLWTYSGPGSANMDDSLQSNVTVTPDLDGDYVFIIQASITSQGLICFDYDTLYLTVEAAYKGIPDAFTPNGDGLNDLFRPIDIDASDISLFRIYNRFGQEVYNGDDLPNGGWDGKLGGVPQPTEVYIYVLTFKRQSDNSETTLRGQVNLIR